MEHSSDLQSFLLTLVYVQAAALYGSEGGLATTYCASASNGRTSGKLDSYKQGDLIRNNSSAGCRFPFTIWRFVSNLEKK
jgi:hypothetical protein